MSELLADAGDHPIRLVNHDDLRRSRLTVFFRMLLALPHYIWVGLYGIVVMFVVLAAWFVGLVRGRIPTGMHEFIARYIRYRLYVSAYADLAADPFPPFSGTPGSYPVDIEIDPATDQSRLTIFFRMFMAIPALIISGVLNYLLGVVTFFSWFYALVVGRQSPGMEKVLLYGLRYQAQTYGYAYMLTGRYPAL
jgi:hypothetical protein